MLESAKDILTAIILGGPIVFIMINSILQTRRDRKELRGLRAQRKEQCKWSYDGDMWDTGCGTGFHFEEGGLIENNMNFCHKCGGKVVDDTEENNDCDGSYDDTM